MVADACSLKAASAPIGDNCLRMKVTSPLMDMIKEDQVEGLKKENRKIEQIRGQIPLFVWDGQGLLTQCGQVWYRYLGV